MKQGNALALISRIRENSNRFIVAELTGHGVKGIVPSHGDILMALFTGSPFTMKELAEKIHRTKPTVTVLIDKLVQYGYVTKEKCRLDSRVTYIKLTEKGFALKPSFEDISEKLQNILYDGLTTEDAEFLEQILRNINQNFKNRTT